MPLSLQPKLVVAALRVEGHLVFLKSEMTQDVVENLESCYKAHKDYIHKVEI